MAVAAAALVACAPRADRESPALPRVDAGEFGEPACFHPAWVGNFEVLDARNLLVFAQGAQEAYHVQVSPPASELHHVSSLAFETRSSRVCGFAGDKLLLPRSAIGRVSVTGVYRLDSTALAGLRGRFDIAGRSAVRPPPQAGPGAQVERVLDGEE